MTREEADLIGGMNMCDEISNEAYKKIMCHCEEQEPCEDAISRQAVLKIFANNPQYTIFCGTAEALIKALPPVTPKIKIGRWLRFDEESPNDFKCSECETILCSVSDIGDYKFCPNCGAKMQEVEG